MVVPIRLDAITRVSELRPSTLVAIDHFPPERHCEERSDEAIHCR
jgi:hypothetical protein